MNKNVGSLDKKIRIAIAAILLAIAFLASVSATLKTVLIVVAVILVLTSVVSFCPLYRLIGQSSCKTGK